MYILFTQYFFWWPILQLLDVFLYFVQFFVLLTDCGLQENSTVDKTRTTTQQNIKNNTFHVVGIKLAVVRSVGDIQFPP